MGCTVAETRILRTTWASSFAVACLVLAGVACGGAGAGTEESGESAGEPPVAPAAQGNEQFDVTVDASALSTEPLEREAFVDDACRFASAEQMAAFFAFHGGTVTADGDDGLYAGTECAYALEDPEVFAEVQFSQMRASGTEEVELAGMTGVRRNASGSTLENRARVQIPFRIEGSPVEAVVVQFHVRGVPPADEDQLRAAIDALGANLIERLGLAETQ